MALGRLREILANVGYLELVPATCRSETGQIQRPRPGGTAGRSDDRNTEGNGPLTLACHCNAVVQIESLRCAEFCVLPNSRQRDE